MGAGLYSHLSTRNLIEENRTRADWANGEVEEEVRQLRFCLAHDIRQCDDESIATWNEAHPDDQFTPKTFREIVEAAIER